MREERQSEQSLPQIQIENIISSSTRRVQEKEGEDQIVEEEVFNYFCMFRFLYVELKLKKNLFNNVY